MYKRHTKLKTPFKDFEVVGKGEASSLRDKYKDRIIRMSLADGLIFAEERMRNGNR